MDSQQLINIIAISAAAISALAVLFGIGLAIASKIFAVQTDPRLDAVAENLPGANCGACGFAGCAALAEALVKGEAMPGKCPVASGEANARIAEILGIEIEEKERSVAVLMCNGGNKVPERFDYTGLRDCKAAALVHGGFKSCEYGCLGLGTCAAACPFDAIRMGPDGLPEIIEERCTACGRCVEACPKNLIKIVPVSKAVHVRCSSFDKGAAVIKICDTGCIGCKKCEKECPVDAIKVENNLARIDYDKCISCGKCVKVCPTGAIGNYRKTRKAGAFVPSVEAQTSQTSKDVVAAT